jgi:hypothetical protein
MYKVAVSMAVASVLSFGFARAAEQEVEALKGPEWRFLGMITGFHSVVHKKSGFEARLLEADGSASVAMDPISLFLVVSNNGTADRIERAWRISRGVERVRNLVATKCGIDVNVGVDDPSREDPTPPRVVPRVLHLCFLSPDQKLQPTLKVREASR